MGTTAPHLWRPDGCRWGSWPPRRADRAPASKRRAPASKRRARWFASPLRSRGWGGDRAPRRALLTPWVVTFPRLRRRAGRSSWGAPSSRYPSRSGCTRAILLRPPPSQTLASSPLLLRERNRLRHDVPLRLRGGRAPLVWGGAGMLCTPAEVTCTARSRNGVTAPSTCPIEGDSATGGSCGAGPHVEFNPLQDRGTRFGREAGRAHSRSWLPCRQGSAGATTAILPGARRKRGSWGSSWCRAAGLRVEPGLKGAPERVSGGGASTPVSSILPAGKACTLSPRRGPSRSPRPPFGWEPLES